MQYLGTIDKAKDIINKDFVEKLLGDYQPLINESSKLPYSLISGVPTSLPASDVYPWAKASTKPSYSYSEITGAISTTELQNYLTQNSYLNVTSGDNRYLKLSGGEISGTGLMPLTINTSNSGIEILLKCKSNTKAHVGWSMSDGVFMQEGESEAYIGVQTNKIPYYFNGTRYTLWHEGNFTPSNYLPLSGGALTGNYYSLTLKSSNQHSSVIKFENTNGVLGYMGLDAGGNPALYDENLSNGKSLWHAGNDGADSGLDADLLDGQQGSWYQGNIHSFARINYTSSSVHDANVAINGMLYNYGSSTYWRNTPDMSYGQILTLKSYGSNELMGQLAWDIRHGKSDTTRYLWWRAIQDESAISNAKWHQIAFTDSNVASATKLQTARTFWGQSFDGTGNVVGSLTNAYTISYNASTNGYLVGHRAFYFGDGVNGLVLASMGDNPITFATRATEVMRISYSGNVGIGTASPSTKLHVAGNFRTNDVWIGSDTGTYIEGTQTGGLRIQYANSENKYTQIHLKDLTVTINNNLLCSGGITMYSDQRKKTILNHVELSLKQIADAPLIEHYYNSDEKKTTHEGSIAQYWANMNDWFCKLDSEGFYTMEIQNAALASAISIARELDRYETKTDKAIKKLKKRICELEEEVERLKAS